MSKVVTDNIFALKAAADQHVKNRKDISLSKRHNSYTFIRCLFMLILISLLVLLVINPDNLSFFKNLSLGSAKYNDSLSWSDYEQLSSSSSKRLEQYTIAQNEWRQSNNVIYSQGIPKPSTSIELAQLDFLSPNLDYRISTDTWHWSDDSNSVYLSFQPLSPKRNFLTNEDILLKDTMATNYSHLAAILDDNSNHPNANPFIDSNSDLRSIAQKSRNEVNYSSSTIPSSSLQMLSIPGIPVIEKSTGQDINISSLSTPLPPSKIDWSKQAITSEIPGAYLMIYPKLKFIGLCIPGQGYIRKYNNVSVPVDLINEKLQADDGRTPYGKYYIIDRLEDSEGYHLFLSWPSIEDGERAGLSPSELSEIKSSWQNKSIPPQYTSLGGGVSINGLSTLLNSTEGGFSLTPSQVKEIYTALPKNAWVLIEKQ